MGFSWFSSFFVYGPRDASLPHVVLLSGISKSRTNKTDQAWTLRRLPGRFIFQKLGNFRLFFPKFSKKSGRLCFLETGFPFIAPLLSIVPCR